MPELTIKILMTVWLVAFTGGLISFYIPHPKALKISMALGGVAFVFIPALVLFLWIMFGIWE